ncbi:MAG: hypothetical protein HOO67_05185 [Candidatus Peribacteraceae bacterium]|nr:hypothetical protein [Candidatus Peribacteraceae bacterium]
MMSTARTIGIAAAILFSSSAPSVLAQQESFFDVFFDVQVTDQQCAPCDALRDEIARTQLRMDEIRLELDGIDAGFGMLDELVAQLKDVKSDVEKQLEEMNDPKNFAESGGRRFDSSDHAALQRRNANLWKSYKSGRMTAQEYSEEIGKPFDDPEVAEDLKLLKEMIKEELQDRIEDLQKALDRIESDAGEILKKAEALTAELASLGDVLAGLKEQLADCRNRCLKEPIDIPGDYGIGQEDKGFFGGLFDAFAGLFRDDPPVFPGLDELIKGLGDPPLTDESAEDQLKKLEEELKNDPSAGESFFDIFIDVPLPPRICHLCDPLRQEVMDAEADLDLLRRERVILLDLENELRLKRGNAQEILIDARKALDRFEKPSASAESEGRRLDSNDQAAMRVRNAGLWADYKSGGLSAQELESEWKKPFDDPEVKKQLDEIKKKMREELEQALKDAEAAMKKIQEGIDSLAEPLREIGSDIAVREVLLKQLLEKLEECEKKCVMIKDQEPAAALPEFEGFMFPQPPEEYSDAPKSDDKPPFDTSEYTDVPDFGDKSSGSPENDQDDEEGDWDESDADRCPAPLFADQAQCQFACALPCYLAESNAGIKRCYACDRQKDTIPDCEEPTFEKGYCEEKCGELACKARYVREGGLECFACADEEEDEEDPYELGDAESIIGGMAQENPGFLCGTFGLFCPDSSKSSSSSSSAQSSDKNTGVMGEGEMKAEEKKTDSGWSCDWFGLFCPKDAPQNEDGSSSESASSASSDEGKCDDGTMKEVACRESCSGECTETYEDFGGLKCFTCVARSSSGSARCAYPSETEADCRETCFDSCVKKYTRPDGVGCFDCVRNPPSSARSKSSSSSSSKLRCEETSFERAECEKSCDGACVAAYVRNDNVACYTCVTTEQNPCPLGSTPDYLGCEKICRPEGGRCDSNNGCYSCVFPEPEKEDRATGPTVTSTSPGNGTKDVPVDVRPKITFSTAMLRNALQSAIGGSFPFTFELVNPTTVVLVPTTTLQYDKDYDFRISASATDMNGTPLAQTVVVKFRTQKKPKDVPAQPSRPPVDYETPNDLPPPASSSSPKSSASAPPASSSSAKPTVQVLILNGKKYPVSQFVIEDHDECTAHYHAANGFDAVSLDGAHYSDPGGCNGYGKVPEVPKQTCATDGTECK